MIPFSPPAAPPLSYLAWGAPARLGVAAIMIALLWLGVVWAIG